MIICTKTPSCEYVFSLMLLWLKKHYNYTYWTQFDLNVINLGIFSVSQKLKKLKLNNLASTLNKLNYSL